MNDDDRIITPRNRVFDTSEGIAVGKDLPYAMRTKAESVYRVTGYNQLKDILATGYVRPKEGTLKGGHKNEIFWSKGSDKLFYFGKDGIIVEAPANKVVNDQIGAIPFSDLIGIWQFNMEKNVYENKLSFYQKVYEEIHSSIHSKTK